jgi:hypothetical protein
MIDLPPVAGGEGHFMIGREATAIGFGYPGFPGYAYGLTDGPCRTK